MLVQHNFNNFISIIEIIIEKNMKIISLLAITILLITINGCGKKTDADYMDQAQQSVKNNNIADAMTAYQNLVKDFPKSDKAPEAVFQMATLYQNKLVPNIAPEESLKKSVDLFRSVYDKYPDSHLAAKALFMSGFILANDLKDYNSATASFNLFLQKFPDNELASSAKEELQNMGLTPEEILSKKNDKKK